MVIKLLIIGIGRLSIVKTSFLSWKPPTWNWMEWDYNCCAVSWICSIILSTRRIASPHYKGWRRGHISEKTLQQAMFVKVETGDDSLKTRNSTCWNQDKEDHVLLPWSCFQSPLLHCPWITSRGIPMVISNQLVLEVCRWWHAKLIKNNKH